MTTDETPRGPRKMKAPLASGTEDRSQPGWPSYVKGPFIAPDYYEQFRPALRPQFEAGTPIGESMSVAEVERELSRGDAWNTPMTFKTAVNVDDREVALFILGPSRGESICVTVPPFGVLRAPVEAFQAGAVGAKIQRWHLIGAAGTCDGAQMAIGAQQVDKCDHYGCPQHDEQTNGYWRHAHTVKQAQRFLKSCGQPLYATGADGRERVLYLPRIEEARNPASMEPGPRIARFVKHVDNRPAVQIYATWRRMEIDENEQEYRRVLAAGGHVSGR